MALGRFRRDVGEQSFMSFLFTDRESDGGGSNRVFGPDFQWRPDDVNTVTGQFLFSRSETPDRPDLADEWDGAGAPGLRRAGVVEPQHRQGGLVRAL